MLSKSQNSLQRLKRPNLSLNYWTAEHLFSVPPPAIHVSHHLHTFGALLRCYCPSEALPDCPIWNCTMFYFLLFISPLAIYGLYLLSVLLPVSSHQECQWHKSKDFCLFCSLLLLCPLEIGPGTSLDPQWILLEWINEVSEPETELWNKTM